MWIWTGEAFLFHEVSPQKAGTSRPSALAYTCHWLLRLLYIGPGFRMRSVSGLQGSSIRK